MQRSARGIWHTRTAAVLCLALLITVGLFQAVQAIGKASSYRFINKWPGSLHNLRGIDADSSGNICVTDGNSIQKFTSKGKLITKWEIAGPGERQLGYLPGIAIDKNGNVYVASSTNDSIQEFTSTGKLIAKWGDTGKDKGQFMHPADIAVDKDGNIYVVEVGNCRVQKFTSMGKFITNWGTYGTKKGQFNSPSSIAVDKNGNVYVADTENHRVQKFNSAGKYMTMWGGLGGGKGQFTAPQGLAIDKNGKVYVVDGNGDVYLSNGSNRVQKFSATGKFITQWGSTGSHNGQFNNPYGIAVDKRGRVYVVDNGNNRIQVFAPAK